VTPNTICFSLDTTNDKVTFIFNETTWAADLAAKNITTITAVEVRGSFNGWPKTSGTTEYPMTKDSSSGIWTVTKSYADIKRPGNSGQPEFKFVVNKSTWMDGTRPFAPEGYIFRTSDNNHIIVFSTDNIETIKANSIDASTVKEITSFDLTTTAGQQQLANFRQVPGGTKLFRSYHPFKLSKTTFNTEDDRVNYVVKLAEANSIASVICLSNNETASLSTYTMPDKTSYTETIPTYLQTIITNGNILYVGLDINKIPSYNDVYYASNGAVFGGWIKETVQWINTHPAPFQIHCRLGTDRTGVFCAILAALQGASWTEIYTDYQSSNNMGIKEFRDYHLLKYSLENMLGVSDISTVANLKETMANYFINGGYLTQTDIDNMINKLK
ncbi:MAG: hypothetical protein A2086_09520, partial [Spirochaetes bacterium GWD1_27_9]